LSGFEAISANNGWEYALLGVSIVFSGLVILSFVISQLHKLLTLWDNRESVIRTFKTRSRSSDVPNKEDAEIREEPKSLVEAREQYRMLVDRIGEPFSLPKLLRLAEKSGLYRPHATINDLIQAGVILPDETGYYIWKS
jgi:hypothetical protein